MTKLIFFRYSDAGLLYPAKGAVNRKLHPMLMFSRYRRSWFSVKNVGEKKDSDRFQCPWDPGIVFQSQPSYGNYYHSKQATLFCCYIYVLSKPLPPTGHPEACWNTMPEHTRSPTRDPNMEVTSSRKNGIVGVEKLNTAETSYSILQRILTKLFLLLKKSCKAAGPRGEPDMKYHKMEFGRKL